MGVIGCTFVYICSDGALNDYMMCVVCVFVFAVIVLLLTILCVI